MLWCWVKSGLGRLAVSGCRDRKFMGSVCDAFVAECLVRAPCFLATRYSVCF